MASKLFKNEYETRWDENVMATVRLPKVPKSVMIGNPELGRYLSELSRTIEIEISKLNEPIYDGYTLDNVPTSGSRTIDADTATLDEVRKVVARFLKDLKTKGRLN